VNDEIALAKCVRPSIILTAFQSHTPDAIGPTVAAFARFYASRGKMQAARKLLHRALAVVHPLGCSWDLTLEVALRGALSDIPQARNLLQTRMLHPSHDVAAAFLLLFDAIVAQRTKRTNAIEISAMEAMQRFEKLHWYGYANLARKLWPSGTQITPIKEVPSKPVIDMHAVLTIREQQVAELVLKGLTNREIASRLSITKHTVDSHVASLMSRLGIRSRYQLPEVLPQEEGERLLGPLTAGR
jgi:DNA-binding CsgD family transcriptional regulator